MDRLLSFFRLVVCIVLSGMFFTEAWEPSVVQIGFMFCWFILASALDFLSDCGIVND